MYFFPDHVQGIDDFLASFSSVFLLWVIYKEKSQRSHNNSLGYKYNIRKPT